MTTNWIKTYNGNSNAQPQKFQAGGPMDAGAAPVGPEAGAPDMEGMLMEYAESRDPQLAVAICDTLVEMMSAQQGAPAGDAGMAPPMARKGTKMSNAPVFRK